MSIPKLIHQISKGLTLQAGDVIATGTPAGVGVGMKPPKFLQTGDLVEVSVSGLGKLSNRVTGAKPNKMLCQTKPSPTLYNFERSWHGAGLTKIADKWINVHDVGSSQETIVFVHGLGASLEYYSPLIEFTKLQDKFRIISYDLEGHGLTPTQPSHTTSINSYVRDLHNLLALKQVSKATIIGWSLGGLIAMRLAEQNPALVEKLVLLGPGPNPFPKPAVDIFTKRAALVRQLGMDASGVAKVVATAATSEMTRIQKPVQLSAVRQSLLATHPEGYAKGCTALARSTDVNICVEKIDVPTLLIAGRYDKISPITLAEAYAKKMPNAKLEILEDVGHWHIIEDVTAVASVLTRFL